MRRPPLRQALLDAGCALGSAARILREREAQIWCAFAKDAIDAYEAAGRTDLLVGVFGRDLLVRTDLKGDGR